MYFYPGPRIPYYWTEGLMEQPQETEKIALSPLVTNPPATLNVSLFKQLTGYNNYGNPSGNADIIYTNTQGVYTFNLIPQLFNQAKGARLNIRAVLDDHASVPVRNYSARITINGQVVHDGPVPLPHGVPVGQKFTNWKTLTFNVRDLKRENRVVIRNTSKLGAGDWIALDWMEMVLQPK